MKIKFLFNCSVISGLRLEVKLFHSITNFQNKSSRLLSPYTHLLTGQRSVIYFEHHRQNRNLQRNDLLFNSLGTKCLKFRLKMINFRTNPAVETRIVSKSSTQKKKSWLHPSYPLCHHQEAWITSTMFVFFAVLCLTQHIFYAPSIKISQDLCDFVSLIILSYTTEHRAMAGRFVDSLDANKTFVEQVLRHSWS